MTQEEYNLEQFGQAALEIRSGCITAMNGAARRQLPHLAVGAPAPAGLTRSLELGSEAGSFAQGEESYLFTRIASPGREVVLFHPARDCGVTGPQLDGFSRQMRDKMGGLLQQLELFSAQEDEPAGSDPRLARFSQSFHQMLRLIHNLEFLNVPLEQAEAQFRPVTMDLAGLCAQTARQAAPLLRKAGVELTCSGRCAGLLIPGDPELLQRMLLDLISNAAKSAKTVCLDLRPWEDRAVLTVSDSGGEASGLAALLRRQEEGIPAPQDGAGMGLDVVRRIVHLHRGALLAQENDRGGLVFTVALPAGPLPGQLPLESPRMETGGGLSPFLVGLSDLLPAELFQPDAD